MPGLGLSWCFYGTELKGKLHVSSKSIVPFSQVLTLLSRRQAYDQHLNMILSDVEETVTTREIDEEIDEEIVKRQTRKVGMLFVRGDIVVLVSPPVRS